MPLFAEEANNITLSLTLSLTSVSVVIAGLWKLIKFRDYLKELERKLDTMWNAQFVRGRIEGERSGHMIFTSDRSITDDSFKLSVAAYDLFRPIVHKLRAVGERMPNANDKDLSLVIERHFGKWIVDNVCRPLGLGELSCLVMAVALARSVRLNELVDRPKGGGLGRRNEDWLHDFNDK